MRYVELHSGSAFSFLRGASFPEQLAETAAELEMPAMALLDRNGVYGAQRFSVAARAQSPAREACALPRVSEPAHSFSSTRSVAKIFTLRFSAIFCAAKNESIDNLSILPAQIDCRS